MGSYARAKDHVTVGSVSAHPRSGTFPESSANATTESVINMTASSAQGTAFVTVAAVTAGKAGLGTPVKSGWGLNTDPYTWKILRLLNLKLV